MKIGDLVFVHGGAADRYNITKPGSWGYVETISSAYSYADVRFHYTPSGDRYTLEQFGINLDHLHVLPDPPATPEEITALVEALARVTR